MFDTPGMGELARLYLEDGLSLAAIAALSGCSMTTVWRRLQKEGVQCRPGGSEPKYPRSDFSGEPAEMAYLLGLRIGDLNVERDGSRTIVVKCTSTRTEQVDLFRTLFSRYGHVYTDEQTMAQRARQSIGMEVRLNRTFEFLLPKEDRIPDWVLERDDTFFAFFSGYLDAEGYIRTYLPPGYRTRQVRIEVRSYEKVILQTFSAGLNQRDISCPPAALRVLAGYVNGRGIPSNGDQWGLGIFQKESLKRLFTKIEPYVKHARRRSDMLQAWRALDASISDIC
jgi:hypothetical protein